MKLVRRQKKGFTLIELMVVVAIIGVLALLGLRLYTGQQQKAKNSIVKANAGTIQTLIQAELADATFSEVNDMLTATPSLFAKSGIRIPDGGAQTTAGSTSFADGDQGEVYVTTDTSGGTSFFKINGWAFESTTGTNVSVYESALTARK